MIFAASSNLIWSMAARIFGRCQTGTLSDENVVSTANGVAPGYGLQNIRATKMFVNGSKCQSKAGETRPNT